MNNSLVSICMTVWNGERFLKQTIESLQAQTWTNFELLILDNQSTDGTSLICSDLANHDKRIRYITDTKQRGVIEAQKLLFSMAKGDFLMLACDDDVYAPNYLSVLMGMLVATPTIGIAYSGYCHIDPSGAISKSGLRRFFTKEQSSFHNFYIYIKWRDPIPIIFGIIRKSAYLKAIDYYMLANNTFSNHDNLYLLKLLSLYRVDSISDPLFFYRSQDRRALYEKRGVYKSKSPFNEYFDRIAHQIAVSKVINKIILDSPNTISKKLILRFRNLSALLFFCRPKYLIDNLKNS